MNANEIIDQIEKIFPDAECELFHQTTFQLLVAVVLSAQTTDASVNKITPALFQAYPDCQALACAKVEDVEEYIKSIGLFHSKAKNLVALSQMLISDFGGEVPSSHKELAKLPGVGRKTANVVRSVAFNIPSFAVDTHVERVSKRLGLAGIDDSVEKVEEKLKRKIDRERWNQAHHDMIFFGRYFCMAKKPSCQECPFAGFCRKEELEAYKKAKKGGKSVKRSTKDKEANRIVQEAEILVQAQSMADAGMEDERDEIGRLALDPAAGQVLSEAKALVQAEQELDNVSEKEHPELGWEKMSDEQLVEERFDETLNDQEEQDFKNDIVNSME